MHAINNQQPHYHFIMNLMKYYPKEGDAIDSNAKQDIRDSV